MQRTLTLRIILLFAAVVVPLSGLRAVPAYPHPVVVEQPDGTRLTIQTYGDEFFHYTLTSDGYNVVQGQDGFYYYAEAGTSGLRSSGVKAQNPARRTAADRTVLGRIVRGAPSFGMGVRQQNKAQLQSVDLNAPEMAAMRQAVNSAEPFKSLVILVSFTDRDFVVNSPEQAFQNMLMENGYAVNGAKGSAWNYYQDNSHGRFNPDFVAVGPYKLPHNVSYYGGNDAYGDDANPRQMIYDAMRLAHEAGVNFADYADGNKGRDIFVFYAGYNEAEGGPSNTVWPHRWSLSPSKATYDGVTFSGYACTSELKGASGSTMAGIGTFCHEFGHVLGWPDFYDTDYQSNGLSPALDRLSLMDSGSYNDNGRTPPALTIMERWMVGWAEPVELLAGGNYALAPVDGDHGFIIKSDVAGEFYLFENRQPGTYPWDRWITNQASTGMLIYHVDQSSNIVHGYKASDLWGWNTLNNYSDHECMRIMQAKQSAYLSNWFYPGGGGVTTYNEQSAMPFKLWNGQSLGYRLTNIREDGTGNVLFTLESDHQAGIYFGQTELKAYLGDVGKIEYQTNRIDPSARILWENTHADVIEVDDQGNYRALKSGTSTLTVRVEGTEYSATCVVTVQDEIQGDVTFTINSPDNVRMSWTAAITRPAWQVEWKESTATQWQRTETTKAEYTFTGLKAGTKYDVHLGGKRQGVFFAYRTLSFSTEGVVAISEIQLPEEILLVPTGMATVEPVVLPENATNREVTYEIADKSVATVTDAGVLTGIAKGQTTLTVRGLYSNVSATCQVRVEQEPADLKAEAGQNDAILTWKAVLHTGAWDVRYRKSGAEEYAALQSESTEAYLSLLEPGTTYEVIVRSISSVEGEYGDAVRITFQTGARQSNDASITEIRGTYTAGDPIRLAIANFGYPIRSIVWTLDGKAVAPPYVTAEKGAHTLRAVITGTTGDEEIIIKKIKVN